MIRKRIKQRIDKRRQNRANKNEESDDSFDKIDQGMIEDESNVDTSKPSETISNNASIQSSADQDIDENFNYLTDICKEKKFNKKEFSIILKVIKLELQPMIYWLLFIKGVLVWTNTAVTAIILVVLLYFAYISIVKYLFGLCFLINAALMFAMKTNRENTIFSLALLVGLVTSIDDDDNEGDYVKSQVSGKETQEKDLKRWQVFKKARRIRQKIQKKFIQLGEFQFLLYQLSIYIGKLRAVCFYKDEKLGRILCIIFGVIGLLFLIFPLRFNYVIIVLLLFTLKPGLTFIRKKRGLKKGEKGPFAKKMKAEIDKIEPDIPKISVNGKDTQ